MADVTIYGPPQSTYVWTTRLACAEKGISHDLEPVEFGSEALLERHPFGKVPAFEHEGFRLFESGAIVRYVDQMFDGPALQPEDPKSLALMNQWVSTICDYGYENCVRRLLFHRMIRPSRGLDSDENLIAESLPVVQKVIDLADAQVAETGYLVGEDLTLADLYLAPILFWISMTPEGGEKLATAGALGAWRTKIEGRNSFQETTPPMPQQEAAE